MIMNTCQHFFDAYVLAIFLGFPLYVLTYVICNSYNNTFPCCNKVDTAHILLYNMEKREHYAKIPEGQIHSNLCTLKDKTVAEEQFWKRVISAEE